MSAEEFWKAFTEYKDLLMDIDSLEKTEADKLLKRLDGDLKKYCEDNGITEVLFMNNVMSANSADRIADMETVIGK